MNNQEVLLQTLKKGDCFMFNNEPYIVKRIYWSNFGMLKCKTWVSIMKFDKHDWHSTGDITVYKISKGLYDLLVQN